MNYEFLTFILFSLFYIMIQDKIAILNKLGRFGDSYQAVWDWIRREVYKIVRDEEEWEGAWTTHTLIMLNVAAFIYALSLGYEKILADFGFIPIYAAEAWRWITYQFLHASSPVLLHPFSAHLLLNILYLYVFGDNVEKWLGEFRLRRLGFEINIYAGLFLIYGVIAAAAQAGVVGWGSTVIMVGASGSIAGVLGMYFILFPNNKIYIGGRETIPSSIYLMLWFVSQFAVQDISIATTAHVMGFIAGMAVAMVLKRVAASKNTPAT